MAGHVSAIQLSQFPTFMTAGGTKEKKGKERSLPLPPYVLEGRKENQLSDFESAKFLLLQSSVQWCMQKCPPSAKREICEEIIANGVHIVSFFSTTALLVKKPFPPGFGTATQKYPIICRMKKRCKQQSGVR